APEPWQGDPSITSCGPRILQERGLDARYAPDSPTSKVANPTPPPGLSPAMLSSLPGFLPGYIFESRATGEFNVPQNKVAGKPLDLRSSSVFVWQDAVDGISSFSPAQRISSGAVDR